MGCIASSKKSVRKSIFNVKTSEKCVPESFVISNNKKFTEVYFINEQLGFGAFGKVKKVVHIVTGQERAVKIIKKPSSKHFCFKVQKEISILKSLNHPALIRMYEHFEDEKKIFLVFEKCDGGDLFEQVRKKGSLTESVSAVICKQLFSALSYLHENNIVHRDIKAENILLENPDDFVNIKIVDFGAATHFDEKSDLTEMVGTTYYISPEVAIGHYDEKCDL